MPGTQIKLDNKNKIILFLMAIIFAIFFVSSPLKLLVNAESNRVTSVIEDLQTDPNFSVEAYPSNSKDYSLKIIQIAETTAKELLIYVYQPSAVTTELRAISINISTSIGENFAPKNYSLTFLNSRGVFQKYVVNDFYVKNDALRYYDIISIFRAWNEDLDNKPGADQTISERSYAVGQLWTASTVNGEVSYNRDPEETIEVVDKFVGFVRYSAGQSVWLKDKETACDRHFVAFSTDKKIDELFEADLEYQTQLCTKTKLSLTDEGFPVYGKVEDADAKLTIDDEKKVSVTARTILTSRTFSYDWKTIQTVSEFKDSVNVTNMYESAIFNTKVQSKISENELKNLNNKEWVLTFDNTDYIYDEGVGVMAPTTEEYTIVSNVTILRLKFKTDGVTYNLGVVDNKQTGSGKPINSTTVTNEWGWLMTIIVKVLKIIIYVVLGIAGLILIKLVVDVIKATFSKRRQK